MVPSNGVRASINYQLTVHETVGLVKHSYIEIFFPFVAVVRHFNEQSTK